MSLLRNIVAVILFATFPLNSSAHNASSDVTTLDATDIKTRNTLSKNEIEIISRDVDETGIASAWQSHTFYIKADVKTITNHRWEYKLPLENGEYEIAATSSDAEFTIPPITNEYKYKHITEGYVCGQITFEGMKGDANVHGTYNLTLDLKPHILETKIISIALSPRNPEYYDILIDVWYEGSCYVHSTIEEEYSPIVNTLFSDEPDYTRLEFTDVDLSGYALVSISVRNAYGSDSTTIKIPSETPSTQISSIADKTNERLLDIMVFSPSGAFLGYAKSFDELKNFSENLLILRLQYDKGDTKTIKYLNK